LSREEISHREVYRNMKLCDDEHLNHSGYVCFSKLWVIDWEDARSYWDIMDMRHWAPPRVEMDYMRRAQELRRRSKVRAAHAICSRQIPIPLSHMKRKR
jgi:hypothetical protein